MISYEEYYPYGRSAYRAAASGVDLSLKRYRFTGKERDEETGLDYFGVRYYASWLGRWTSGDPGGFVDGLNLYRYVRNNPVNGIDPLGYSTENVVNSEPPPVEKEKPKEEGLAMDNSFNQGQTIDVNTGYPSPERYFYILIYASKEGDQGHVAVAIPDFDLVDGEFVQNGMVNIYDAYGNDADNLAAFVQNPGRVTEGNIRQVRYKLDDLHKVRLTSSRSGPSAIVSVYVDDIFDHLRATTDIRKRFGIVVTGKTSDNYDKTNVPQNLRIYDIGNYNHAQWTKKKEKEGYADNALAKDAKGYYYYPENPVPIKYSLRVDGKFDGSENPRKVPMSCASFVAWIAAKYYDRDLGVPERISFNAQSQPYGGKVFELPQTDMFAYTPSSIFRGSSIKNKWGGTNYTIHRGTFRQFYDPSVSVISGKRILDTTPNQ